MASDASRFTTSAPLRTRWVLVIGLIVAACAGYVALAVTPSSYADAQRMLGQPVTGLIAGSPKSIRSDEWSAFTPYIQIAVRSHFAAHDVVSPYHEDLKAFFALPIRDWGAVFKPYFIGFLFLPAANAFSLYYLIITGAFLVGWAVLFYQLRIDPRLAILLSMALFFSQFVQVWWTTNCNVLALAPWPAIAWLSIRRSWIRVPVCAYALIVWIMSEVYPPFLYALALVLVVAVIALRPETLRLRRVAEAATAAVVAAAVLLLYFHGLIRLMDATVYPGHRMSAGGGVSVSKFVTQLLPFELTKGYEPLSGIHGSNVSEIGVVGTILPVLALVFVDYRSDLFGSRRTWFPIVIMLCGLLFTCAWIFLPLPVAAGKWLGLGFVPPNRLLLASGWILGLLSAFVMSTVPCRASYRRVMVLLAICVVAGVGKYYFARSPWQDTFSYFDAMPIAATAAIAVFLLLRHHVGWIALAAVAVVVNAATFGLFNPVQSAYPIFSINSDAVRDYLVRNGAVVADGALAVAGQYGATINGAGVPSYNMVLNSPQLAFFRRLVPDLDADQFNFIFNRYAHVAFDNNGTISVPQPDSIILPLSLLAGGSRGMAGVATVRSTYCSLDTIDGVRADRVVRMRIGAPGRFAGWFATTSGKPVGTFLVRLVGGGQPYSFVASDTVERPDVAKALESSGSDLFGFGAGTDFLGAMPGRYKIEFRSQAHVDCDPHVSVELYR